MEGKKRRYDFESNVRVPSMEDICKAAGQFTEPQTPPPVTMRKFAEIPGAKQAAAKYIKKPVIRNEELDIIKQEMEALVSAVVEEEEKSHKEIIEESVSEGDELQESVSAVETAQEIEDSASDQPEVKEESIEQEPESK